MLYKLSLIVTFLFLLSCEERVSPTDKLAVYEELCESIARYSASIESRDINWDSLTHFNRSLISNDLSDKAFFEVIGGLLLNFRDPHVWLISPERSMYSIDSLNYQQNFDKELVLAQYLEDVEMYNSTIYSSMISGNIGYLFCADFKGDATTINSIYLDVFEKFKNTEGLIIDLRINDGGSVYNVQNLLNKLSKERMPWHTTQNRTSNGFDKPYTWYLEPDPIVSYRQKVVVLTGRYTISAGERFVLGAKLLDHVTIVGDTTANTQGSVMGREMLNGWQYTFTFEKVVDINGVNHGGIGIPPDKYISPGKTFIGNRDQAIERALEIIKE